MATSDHDSSNRFHLAEHACMHSDGLTHGDVKEWQQRSTCTGMLWVTGKHL